MLAKSTIAGQEGVITYLANAAALQQFEQAALAYVLMSEAGRAMGAAGLAAAAESLLEGKFEVSTPFLMGCNQTAQHSVQVKEYLQLEDLQLSSKVCLQ